jgi:hypothetical protein
MTIWGLPNSSSLKIPNSLIRAQAEFMPLMYGDESVGVVATGTAERLHHRAAGGVGIVLSEAPVSPATRLRCSLDRA